MISKRKRGAMHPLSHSHFGTFSPCIMPFKPRKVGLRFTQSTAQAPTFSALKHPTYSPTLWRRLALWVRHFFNSVASSLSGLFPFMKSGNDTTLTIAANDPPKVVASTVYGRFGR